MTTTKPVRDFVHLHVHSDYSLLDGACQHAPLLELCKSHGMGAVAVTDHGNLFGAMEFYNKADKAGVKPILGCEVYTVPGTAPDAHRKRSGERDYNHLLLLCETYEGWLNLQRLVSLGFQEGFYYKPRVSHHQLAKHSAGLIATTACLKGEVAQAVLRDEYDDAVRRLEVLRSIFPDRLYVEVQENGLDAQRKANRTLVELAQVLSLPLVATGDVHYLRPEDAVVQDALVCINTGKLLRDEKRMSLRGAQLHFRSREEATEAFAWCPEAVDNTVAIARRCSVNLKKEQFGKVHLPAFWPPDSYDDAEDVGDAGEYDSALDHYFCDLCEAGLHARYGAVLPDAVMLRYEEELSVIRKMKFQGYLLVVWDFITWAKSSGIPVGPGRGSAAGSIICYALGITDLCPLEWGLLFERFLNKERVSLPDIDVDFCQRRRGEVLEYVRKKYGSDKVAGIATFNTLAARAAVKDVARVLAVPFDEANWLTSLIPGDLAIKHKKLKDAYLESPDLDKARRDARYAQLFSIAEQLEGMARNVSLHAAGVVISDVALVRRAPLYVDQKTGTVATQFDMDCLEKECGLVKMDFLGLKTLTVIRACLDNIEAVTGSRPDVSPARLPLRDPSEPTAARTYALLQRGDARGVFQFESAGYRELLVKLKPDGFEDIIALGALYRPGPLEAGMVDAYVNRKHGLESVSYPDPRLEPALRHTYGCMIYQEQVMQIANVLARFTLPEADSLRKAMGKKKPEEMKSWRGKFVDGAVANGCSRELAETTWQQMEFFAGYGFNRAHAAAYGLLSFQTAWLKANYPEEFMAALLSSEVSVAEKVVEYVDEARRMGIAVLPPSVERSAEDFSVEVAVDKNDGSRHKVIRYGLLGVKLVGEATARAIVAARKSGAFRSVHDLCARACVPKPALVQLIGAGALDSLGRRAALVAAADGAAAEGRREAGDAARGQANLFAAVRDQMVELPLPDVQEWDERTSLAAEKEALGFYLTGHPLGRWARVIDEYATPGVTSRNLAGFAGEEVTIAATIVSWRTHVDKRHRTMAFLALADADGTFDAVSFAATYERVRPFLAADLAVLVAGKVDSGRERLSFVVNDVLPLEQAERVLGEELRVRVPAGREGDLGAVGEVLAARRGSAQVTFECGRNTRVSGPRVDLESDVVRAVEAVLGHGTCFVRRVDR